MLSFTVEGSDAYKQAFGVIASYINHRYDRGKDDEPQSAICPVSWEQVDEATRMILKDVDSNYYTAFEVRSDMVEDLEKSLREELEFCTTFQRDNPKSFALWSHRTSVSRRLAQILSDEGRIDFFWSEINQSDAWIDEKVTDRKNHSTWTYRIYLLQCLVSMCELSHEHAIHVDKLLENERDSIWQNIYGDVFNNSVWSYLHGVFRLRRLRAMRTLSPEERRCQWYEEVIKVGELIAFRPNNECAWNYLYALYKTEDDIDCDLDLPVVNVESLPLVFLNDVFSIRYTPDDVGLMPIIVHRFRDFLTRHGLYDVIDDLNLSCF